MAARSALTVEAANPELDMVYDAAQLLRSRSSEDAPAQVAEQIVRLVRSGPLRVLE